MLIAGANIEPRIADKDIVCYVVLQIVRNKKLSTPLLSNHTYQVCAGKLGEISGTTLSLKRQFIKRKIILYHISDAEGKMGVDGVDTKYINV